MSDGVTLETGSLPRLDDNPGDVKEKEKKPRGVAAVRIRLEKMEPELADKLVEYIGLPISVVSPLAAGVIDARSEKTAKSLIRLAETSPRFRKALEAFIAGSTATDLGLTAIAVIVAVRVDLSNQTPDEMGMVARYFDIDEIYYQVYPDYREESSNGNGNGGVPHMGLMGEVD